MRMSHATERLIGSILAAVIVVALASSGTAQAGGDLCFGRTPTIVGTDGPDMLVGTRYPDVIYAGAGNDYVLGDGGGDFVCAGDGNDASYGDNGDDVQRGGAGHDGVYGRDGDDTSYGGPAMMS